MTEFRIFPKSNFLDTIYNESSYRVETSARNPLERERNFLKTTPYQLTAHALNLRCIKATASEAELSVAACSTPRLLVSSEVVPRY